MSRQASHRTCTVAKASATKLNLALSAVAHSRAPLSFSAASLLPLPRGTSSVSAEKAESGSRELTSRTSPGRVVLGQW